MPNPYYNHASQQPVQLSRGSSPVMRSEFDQIASAFTSANVDIMTRGQISGQAWTGTHDFSGASIKVPTLAYGSSGNYAVSWDALNAAVFAAANMPGQTGKLGYFLTTDGATPSWGNALNCTVIKFKDGTDATKLLAFDVSALTTATTRTVAWPDKSGTAALISDVGVSAPLAVITPTAAANIDLLSVFTSAYDYYAVEIEGVAPAVMGGSLQIRLANAGAIDSGSNYVGVPLGSSSSTTSTSITSNAVNSTGGSLTNSIRIRNTNDAANFKSLMIDGVSMPTSGSYGYTSGAYAYIGGAVSGLRLSWSNGSNFAAQGRVRVYGFKN